MRRGGGAGRVASDAEALSVEPAGELRNLGLELGEAVDQPAELRRSISPGAGDLTVSHLDAQGPRIAVVGLQRHVAVAGPEAHQVEVLGVGSPGAVRKHDHRKRAFALGKVSANAERRRIGAARQPQFGKLGDLEASRPAVVGRVDPLH